MFDPSIGRWLEMDPIAFDAGDANLYRAMGNNPTNATDPSGLAGSFMYEPAKIPQFLGGNVRVDGQRKIGYAFQMNITLPTEGLPRGNWNFVQVNKIQTTVVTYNKEMKQFKVFPFEAYTIDWNRQKPRVYPDTLEGPYFKLPPDAGPVVLVFSLVKKSARIASEAQDAELKQLLGPDFAAAQGVLKTANTDKNTLRAENAEKALKTLTPPEGRAYSDFELGYVSWNPSNADLPNLIAAVRGELNGSANQEVTQMAKKLAQFEGDSRSPLGKLGEQWLFGTGLPDKKNTFRAELDGTPK